MRFDLVVLALAIERYGAFAAPPKRRHAAKNRACVGQIFIWLLGTMCGLPMAIFAYQKVTYRSIKDGQEEKYVVSRQLHTDDSGNLAFHSSKENFAK